MFKFGIDVSKWQGANFDFNKAKTKDKVEFVVLRGAYSVYKDTQFENYYAKCKALNLPVGVYHYSMATTVEEAKAEAKYLHDNVLKGKQFELPIYIDVEDKVQLVLPKALLTAIVKTWCEYLESKKYYVGIYAGKYQLNNNIYDDQLKRYTHWIPMWGKTCTYEDKSVLGMWQFGGDTNVLRSNKIAGVVVDQNYMYVDFPTIIKKNKLNGFGTAQQESTPTVKPTEVVFNIGDKIKLSADAKYSNNKAVPAWVRGCTLHIRSSELEGGYYNVSLLKIGAITGKVHKKYITKK